MLHFPLPLQQVVRAVHWAAAVAVVVVIPVLSEALADLVRVEAAAEVNSSASEEMEAPAV